MKAISLLEPWAYLVAIGAKRTETRSWSTSYRGTLAIHASKTFHVENKRLCCCEPFHRRLRESRPGVPFGAVVEEMPLRCIVAVVTLEACVPTLSLAIEREDERAFGDYSPGRFAWLLTDPCRLREPVRCKGAQGLWTVPSEVEALFGEG